MFVDKFLRLNFFLWLGTPHLLLHFYLCSLKAIALGNDTSGRNTRVILAKISNSLLFVPYPISTVLIVFFTLNS